MTGMMVVLPSMRISGGGVDLGIEGKTCYVDLLLREASLEAISLLCAT